MSEPAQELRSAPRGNWLLACGPGCAVLLIAALIAGLVGWRLSVRSFAIKREEVRVDTTRYLEQLTRAPLPEEHVEVLKAALADSQRPEVGYFGYLLYMGGVIAPHLDEEATPEDLEMARETRQYLAETPAPSFWAYGDYVSSRPALQLAIEAFKARSEASKP